MRGDCSSCMGGLLCPVLQVLVVEERGPRVGCSRSWVYETGQVSGAIKVLSRIPFKDAGSENVLVRRKTRSPIKPTPSNNLPASCITQAPRGVKLPFWVSGFITIPGGVRKKALYRARHACHEWGRSG